MKTVFTLTICFLLNTCAVFSQCSLSFTNELWMAYVCPNDPLVYGSIVTADCVEEYAYIEYWFDVKVLDENNIPVVEPSLTFAGTALDFESIPYYFLLPSDVPEFVEICMRVSLLDGALDTVATLESCTSDFIILEDYAMETTVVNDPCGNSCVLFNPSGGMPPYELTVYDVDWTSIVVQDSMVCIDAEGSYSIQMDDVNTCGALFEFEVQAGTSQNQTCESAHTLSSGIVLDETLCFLETSNTSCGGLNSYMSGWYYINAQNSSHLNLGFNQSYSGNPISQSFNIEVYEAPQGLDCSLATLVYCHEMNDATSCFDLADEITIQPNADYYFHIAAQWTTEIEISIVAVLSDDIIEPICGCNEMAACNYNPSALVNDGSCQLPGCTDAGACNFDFYALCEDGTCTYGDDFNGLIYHDVNGDGLWDTLTESFLGGIGIITIVELNLTVYPNAEGVFVIPDLQAGVYTITFTDANGAWIMSPSSPSQLTLPTCNGLQIGLIPSDLSMAQITEGTWMWTPNILCVNGYNPGIWVQNTGNVPLNGEFTIAFDPLFVPAEFPGYEPYDSFSNGLLTWNIEDQQPGTSAYYAVHINGPGTAYIGQTFVFDLNLTLLDGNENVYYANNWTLTPMVVCAYDPNDKQAIPEGYADQHFIMPDDEIEYRIRFQNTGNAAAEDVMIEDPLAIDHLDLSTFYPVSGSHSFSTLVNEDGRIQFVFNNIFLPDSGSDQLGSNGYVVYRIKPLPDITPTAVINNTAYIYFDQNEAVITNTTFHTIYSCDLIQSLSTEEEICTGLAFTYELNDPYIETYAWFVDDEIHSTENIFIFQSDISGDHMVSLERTNPLCEVTDEFLLHNHPIPGTDVIENGWTLTAPIGTYWDWFLNNEPIAGEHSQTYIATAPGMYTVNTENEFGCVSTSEDIFLVGIEEKANTVISLYPNPMDKEALLKLGQGNYEVTLINLVGEKIQTWSNAKNTLRIDRSSLSSGIYFVKVTNESGVTESVRLVMK